MKRFLAIVALLVVLLGGLYYGIYYAGFYLPLPPRDAVEIPFRAEGTRLQQLENGAYRDLTLRGVEISQVIPGSMPSEYAPDRETYLRWLTWIGELGANAVEVSVVMDADFYDALYEYNTSHPPLLLFQGIGVSEQVLAAPGNAYETGMQGELIAEGKMAVDAVHGRRIVSFHQNGGTGIYRRDVSPWVAGFLIAPEWYPDTIAYTDHSTQRTGTYHGTYFETDAATVTEAMLAEVLDRIARFEAEKYGVLRPMAVVSEPACDFLEYEEVYARQLQKYAFLDMEHILPTEQMAAGRCAAYRLYDFCTDYEAYLSEGQRTELGDALDGVDPESVYSGYLELLSAYHTMPLVASSYSSSSARGCSSPARPPQTEQAQGMDLVEISRRMEADGWAGGFIASWQDVWTRRSWNTRFALSDTTGYLWHDLQTEGQNSGLMAFAPGTEAVCILDGDPGEWEDADLVLDRDGIRLYARYDAECLYLMLEGVAPEDTVYLPLDLSGEAGCSFCLDPALEFDRAADFLLCLEPGNSRLLVQERYDPLRAHFLFETTGEDPFSEPPARDSGIFVPVRMALENSTLVEEITQETRLLQMLGDWETGMLTEGSGDPASPAYDSRTDLCRGTDCVELRLPWLLLNVGDPSSMAVHGDYYTHYGVELFPINAIYLGAARDDASGEISLEPLTVKGWGRSFPWRERLKASYEILRQAWKEGADADGG